MVMKEYIEKTKTYEKNVSISAEQSEFNIIKQLEDDTVKKFFSEHSKKMENKDIKVNSVSAMCFSEANNIKGYLIIVNYSELVDKKDSLIDEMIKSGICIGDIIEVKLFKAMKQGINVIGYVKQLHDKDSKGVTIEDYDGTHFIEEKSILIYRKLIPE